MDYDLKWSNLNAELKFKETEAGGLTAALAELENHQRECGFIQDDLQDVERLVFKHPQNSKLNFRAQVNPKRARRAGGSLAHAAAQQALRPTAASGVRRRSKRDPGRGVGLCGIGADGDGID